MQQPPPIWCRGSTPRRRALAAVLAALLLAPAAASAIDNPYQRHSHWCKGALHLHTTQSDGLASPFAMAEAYKAEGFDFIFITDHNVLTRESRVDGITVLPGEEVSSSGGHSGALGISAYVEPGQSRQETINEVASQGGLLQVNHPSRAGCTKEHLDGLEGLWGFEVRNEPHFRPNDLVLWDGQISQGKRLWGTFSDDAHHLGGIGRGWVMVNTEDHSCASDSVISNLAAGNFYCSEGPNMDIIVRGETVFVSSDTGIKIEWYQQNLTLLKTTNDSSDTYSVVGDETFVRVVVTDSAGKMAWSQPVFLDAVSDRTAPDRTAPDSGALDSGPSYPVALALAVPGSVVDGGSGANDAVYPDPDSGDATDLGWVEDGAASNSIQSAPQQRAPAERHHIGQGLSCTSHAASLTRATHVLWVLGLVLMLHQRRRPT